MSGDTLNRFIFENIAVRGMIVQLDQSWKTLQSRKNYPDIIKKQLGEFAAANVLLAASLKLDGSLTMQIRGNGHVNLLVMECTSENHIRGLAKYDEETEFCNANELYGDGQLALTINNNKTGERYQGIVALDGEDISKSLESYLIQSEQLDTALYLTSNNNKACGLLLQKLPEQKLQDSDDWNRISHLASTITDEELFELSAEEIIHRLFNEDDVRLLDAENVIFHCTCTRERVNNMLLSLGHEEIKSIIDEQGSIEIDCEFCNQHYHYDNVDAEELFATEIHHSAPKTKH